MTQIELVKVLNVIAKADGGLQSVKDLLAKFVKSFPDEAGSVATYLALRRHQRFTPFKDMSDFDVEAILNCKEIKAC